MVFLQGAIRGLEIVSSSEFGKTSSVMLEFKEPRWVQGGAIELPVLVHGESIITAEWIFEPSYEARYFMISSGFDDKWVPVVLEGASAK